MAVEYEISSDVATIKDVAPNTQVARVVSLYSGQITYDDEAGSKFATATIDGKSQRVMLCIAVNGTVTYDDVPSLYSTVDGHRCLNIVAPTETGTPDDVPSVYETVVIDGMNVRAVRCILINETPIYDGVSSTCTFVANGKTHTAQLVNKITGGSVDVIVKGVSPLVLPDAIANSLSYVKAFGGTYQGNIPNTYTQVNYVTNTAQTAVDTGIMIDFAKNYEFEVECRAVSGSWYILQSRASASGNVTGIHGATSGSTIILVVGNVTVCTSAITRTVGNKLYVKATLNAGTATLYVKDETANTEDTQTGSYGTSQPNPTASVYLLGNAGGQYVDVNSDIYMARIKENDTVVMDYVPARQAATAGFYDKASGTFKTALTPANLSADGNTVPTPDAPMNIVSNNGVLKVKDSELPLEYKRLLDISTTGNVFYVSNVYLTGSDTLNFRFKAGAGGNVLGAFNNTDANDNYSFYDSSISTSSYARYNGQTGGSAIYTNNLHDITISPTGVTGVRNPSSFTPSEFTCSIPFCIFATSPGGSPHSDATIYGSIVVTGSQNIKFIPCERVSDGAIGYYETYNGVFLENQGTGTPTTSGYNTSYMTQVYTDGTVETINVHGTNIFNKNDTASIGNWYSSSSLKITNAAANQTLVMRAKPGATYYFKHCSVTGGGRAFYTEVEDWALGSDCSAMSGNTTIDKDEVKSITVSENAKWVFFNYGRSGQTATFEEQLADFMVSLTPLTSDTQYIPYYDGGTATAEMLLKIGNSQDEQKILTGAVTRNVQVIIFDGTESFSTSSAYGDACVTTGAATRWNCSKAVTPICTHFLGLPQASGNQPVNTCFFDDSGHFYFRLEDNTVATFKAWLAAQYAAGTPVMVLVALTTPTTESVAGQTLQVTDGDNTLEITQASLNGLELEAKYKAAVSLTIQEVEDANLDNNVEVTIS